MYTFTQESDSQGGRIQVKSPKAGEPTGNSWTKLHPVNLEISVALKQLEIY